jgi:hypothetical protein
MKCSKCNALGKKEETKRIRLVVKKGEGHRNGKKHGKILGEKKHVT